MTVPLDLLQLWLARQLAEPARDWFEQQMAALSPETTDRESGPNPWGATSLKWCTPETPPRHGNWDDKLPTVHRWAYDFSVPGEEKDFVRQDEPQRDLRCRRSPRPRVPGPLQIRRTGSS